MSRLKKFLHFWPSHGQENVTSPVNSRIIKFDKNGKFILAWETKGKGAGRFDLAHGIAIDNNRRLYVTEENTGRVQIFDENGKYLDEWTDIRDPVDVLITKDLICVGDLWEW